MDDMGIAVGAFVAICLVAVVVDAFLYARRQAKAARQFAAEHWGEK